MSREGRAGGEGRRTPPNTGGILRRAVPVVWLMLVWVLLWGTFSWANVLGGLAIGLLVLLLFPLPADPGGAVPPSQAGGHAGPGAGRLPCDRVRAAR